MIRNSSLLRAIIIFAPYVSQMGRSSSVISFVFKVTLKDSIQPLLPGSCVFWNRLDTVAVKLQGWSKRHLKFGSCGKSQKSNKHSGYFSLSRYFQRTHSHGFVCLRILSSTQVIFRVTVIKSTELSRRSPSLAKAGYLQVNTLVPLSLCEMRSPAAVCARTCLEVKKNLADMSQVAIPALACGW